MSVSVIITATNKFGDFATPFIDTIRKYERDVPILLIDNASPEPYPDGDYKLIRNEQQNSWAKMINQGVANTTTDWMLICNDDLLCLGEFVETIEGFDKNIMYGGKIFSKPARVWGRPVTWTYCWHFAIQRDVYNRVGGMDEGYINSGMEDIDFCWTLQQMGYGIEKSNLPLIHVTDPTEKVRPGRRHKWDDTVYWDNMKKNIARLKRKMATWEEP